MSWGLSVSEIVRHLRAGRYRVAQETQLQADIGNALDALGAAFEREVRLGPGERIDFLVDGTLGIEAKTRCDRRAIYRQLQRYARHDTISALILVTGTALGLPASIDGKPLFYVSVGRSAL